MKLVVLALVLIGGATRAEDGWRREVGELGQPWSEVWVIDGLYDGPWTGWHDNGVVSDRGQFRLGREHGWWQSFDARGRLTSDGAWLAGKPDGPWRFFHASGAVASEGRYVDGLRDGEWLERFPDGALFRSVTWQRGAELMSVEERACRDDELEWRVDLGRRELGCVDASGRVGLWRGFHPDGVEAWQRIYVADEIEGPSFDWHPDGALRHVGAFERSAPVGVHVWLDGDALTSIDYGAGDGPWRDLDVGRDVVEEGGWLGGQRDGVWRAWDSTTGALVSEVEWHELVRVRARLVLDGLEILGRYDVDGRRDGRWTARDADGKLVWDGDYLTGERTGDWTFARAGGDVALVLRFDDEQLVATTRFWPNGQLREDALAVDGGVRRTLLWPDGVVVRSDTLYDGTIIADPDDPDAGDRDAEWERALELQAWLLADPIDEALVDMTAAPTAERVTEAPPVARFVLPVAREMPDASGTSNEAGDPHGVWTWFWDDGARKEQGTFVDGSREAVWRGWDRLGRARWQGSYVADQLSGEWLTYHASGRVASRCHYRAGLREGAWTTFHTNGRIATSGAFVQGQEDGLWRGYDATGALAWQGRYRAGERVGRWTFHSPGGVRETRYGPQSEH